MTSLISFMIILHCFAGCSYNVNDNYFYITDGNNNYKTTKIYYGLKDDRYMIIDAIVDEQKKTYAYDTFNKQILLDESWEKFRDNNIKSINERGLVNFLDNNGNIKWSIDLIDSGYIKDGETYDLSIPEPNVYGMFQLETENGNVYLIDVNLQKVLNLPFSNILRLKIAEDSSSAMVITRDNSLWFYNLKTYECKNATTQISTRYVFDYLKWNKFDKYFYYFELYQGLIMYDSTNSVWNKIVHIDHQVNDKIKWVSSNELIYVTYEGAKSYFNNGPRNYYVMYQNINNGVTKRVKLAKGVEVDNYVISYNNDIIYYHEKDTENCFSNMLSFE